MSAIWIVGPAAVLALGACEVASVKPLDETRVDGGRAIREAPPDAGPGKMDAASVGGRVACGANLCWYEEICCHARCSGCAFPGECSDVHCSDPGTDESSGR